MASSGPDFLRDSGPLPLQLLTGFKLKDRRYSGPTPIEPVRVLFDSTTLSISRGFYGLISIGVPIGTSRQISSISELLTAIQPSVQSMSC